MAALTKRVFVVMATVVLCSAFCLPPAEAALVPIAITAEVTYVGDSHGLLEGRVNVGDLITGVYIYDSSTPDSEPTEHKGVYKHYAPPAGITLTVGGFVFMTDPDNIVFTVWIGNDSPPGLGGCWSDGYGLMSKKNLPLPNGTWLHHIRLGLSDCSHSALSSDTLPTTAPVLDDWDLTDADIAFGGQRGSRGPSFHIDGHLTSAALIPEPATFALLGIGTLVLLRSRERSSQTK